MNELNHHQELALKTILSGIALGTVGFLLTLLFHDYLGFALGTYLSVALGFVGCLLGFIGGSMIVIAFFEKDSESRD